MPTARKISKKSVAKKVIPKKNTAKKPAIKKATPKKISTKSIEVHVHRPNYMTLTVLVGCLMLSIINLYSIINATGYATAMEESRNLMLNNFSRAVENQSDTMALLKSLEKSTEFGPSVLWSAVKLADGEKEAIQANLIEPLLAWQTLAGPNPSAILIERRYPSSVNVVVRLFLENGEEYGFLWPEEGSAMTGIWMPPCGPNTPKDKEPASCPNEYLEKFPQVTEALLELVQ